MMNVDEFKALLAQRDAEIGGDSDWYTAPTALQKLYEDKPVMLFNGSTVKRVETIASFTADYDGEDITNERNPWGNGYLDGADGLTFIVELQDPKDGCWYQFRITGYYDSWDNGNDDMFKATEIVQVEKVTTVVWKEVR